MEHALLEYAQAHQDWRHMEIMETDGYRLYTWEEWEEAERREATAEAVLKELGIDPRTVDTWEILKEAR